MLASGQLTESQFDQQVAATNGDPWIFLNFAAVEVPGSTAVTANDTHHSCFHVRIRQSKFLEWHTRHPVADDGTRFADHRNSGPGYVAWFGYVLNNNPPTGSNYLYDGGWAQGGSAYPPTRFIPAGGSLDLLGPACGQLEQRCVGLSHRCVGAATWMNIDPFVFVDPQLANDGLWKRAMVYNWDDRNGGVNATLFSQWGNHVTAAPLRAYEFVFDTRADVIPMATNRNSTAANLLHGPLLDPRPPEGQCPDPYNTYGAAGDFDNGASNNLAKEWNAGAVAEGVCAFYHPGFNRYYLLYSRNPFGSPAYQIVYRMTAAGQPFTSIQLPSFTATNQPENLLLRSDDFQVGGNQNYGHCEVFTIADSTGTDHYYLMFHAKWKDVAGVPLMRTIFFKELTFTTDGTIRQLAENGTPDVDIHKFRIPYCRP
jgi:hypothetical protein